MGSKECLPPYKHGHLTSKIVEHQWVCNVIEICPCLEYFRQIKIEKIIQEWTKDCLQSDFQIQPDQDEEEWEDYQNTPSEGSITPSTENDYHPTSPGQLQDFRSVLVPQSDEREQMDVEDLQILDLILSDFQDIPYLEDLGDLTNGI